MDFPRLSYPPLPHHIAQLAIAQPHHPAIIDGELTLNYAELDNRIRRGAAKLRQLGVRKGDRAIVVASQKSELALATFAAMAAGAAVAPLAAAEENIARLVDYFEPAIVLLGNRIPSSAVPGANVRTLQISELAAADPGELAPLANEDIGLFILTSGTTGGQRRGAMLSYRALSGTAEYMNEVMGITSDVRELITPPLEHGFGMGRLEATLHLGGTAIFSPPLFSPKVALSELDRHDCNMMSAVVTALGLMLDSEAATLSALASRIRWVELGSAHFTQALWHKLAQCMPKTRLFVSYGLTEARRCTFFEYHSAPEKSATVGKPSRWVRVRIVDENNQPLPPNAVGRIQVDGVNKASGYYKYAEAWEKKQCGDWLDTADNGFLDEAGSLTYAGRLDDAINVGGLKVAPEEVEAELAPLLNGHTYAIARIADPLGIEGQVPALFIETKEAIDLTIEEVQSFLEPHLPPFKIPRQLYCIETIPRTTLTRKIRRGALAALALEQENAQLPKTTALAADLHGGSRRNWPAFAGGVNLSRLQLANVLAGKTAKARSAVLPDSLAWLHKAAQQDDFDLARVIEQCDRLLAPEPNAAIAIGTEGESRFAQALQWRTLMGGGECLLLPPLAQSRVAEDLGWIRRHRPSYVLVDKVRFARLALAEAHLSDAFDFPGSEHLLIAGAEPEAGDLLQFRRIFDFDPQHISALGAVWSMRTLRPKQDSADVLQSEEIWRILRKTAAGIFRTDPEMLQLDSSTENTKGWNSLGYLQLIMALEEAFGRSLAPRDIMAVRQLRDLVSILGTTRV